MLTSVDSLYNLYTTDFRGQLLSLESSKFHRWLDDNYPSEANRIPWVPDFETH